MRYAAPAQQSALGRRGPRPAVLRRTLLRSAQNLTWNDCDGPAAGAGAPGDRGFGVAAHSVELLLATAPLSTAGT